MPNHFHIVLKPLVERGIQQYMQKLSTAYSMYFNKRNHRTGSLFEGKFKARHIDSDEYLKYLYAYIHLNPVKLIDSTWRVEGIKDPSAAYEYVASYPYSSLPDYLGIVRKECVVLDPKYFPDYFTSPVNIKTELFEWLEFAPKIL
jgi:putative transposase